jgi:hypothetical protein
MRDQIDYLGGPLAPEPGPERSPERAFEPRPEQNSAV